jgi:hypothetical protein
MTTRIVAFVLLSLFISVTVVILASHKTISVLLTVKAPSANLLPLLRAGSNFSSTIFVADPYVYFSYLGLPKTIIWCTFNRLLWSVPHVVCARHFIISIFFFVLAFVLLMYSSQFILLSNVSPEMRCCLICSIFSSFAHMVILGLVCSFFSAKALVFSVNTLNPVSFTHLIILFIAFCIRIVTTRWCWCVACTIQSSVCVADYFGGFFYAGGDFCHCHWK